MIKLIYPWGVRMVEIHKSINMILQEQNEGLKSAHHLNKAEKALGKIQHPFHDKNSQQNR